MTLEDFFAAVLESKGLPASTNNIAVLSAMARAEGTSAAFNPLASTQGPQGQSGGGDFNSAGVWNYSSAAEGIMATADTITNGNFPELVYGLQHSLAPDYYINGAGFTSLKTWQRGAHGASTPAPSNVTQLASSSIDQLLAWARNLDLAGSGVTDAGGVAVSSVTGPPASSVDATLTSAARPSSSSANVFDPSTWLPAIESSLASWVQRLMWVGIGVVAIGLGLFLVVFEDLEDAAEKAGNIAEHLPPVVPV